MLENASLFQPMYCSMMFYGILWIMAMWQRLAKKMVNALNQHALACSFLFSCIGYIVCLERFGEYPSLYALVTCWKPPTNPQPLQPLDACTQWWEPVAVTKHGMRVGNCWWLSCKLWPRGCYATALEYVCSFLKALKMIFWRFFADTYNIWI